MEKFFDPIVDLLKVPLIFLLELLGLPENLVEPIAVLVVVIMLVGIVEFVKHCRVAKLSENLNPEFDFLTVKGYRKIFIQTKYDRVSPNRYENPHEAFKHNSPRKLIPFMLKKSFNERIENEKFYLILADSGMGKTAFMVNLYLRFYSIFHRRRNLKMKLFKFQPPEIGNPEDVLDRIKRIEECEAKDTILLMDGLDEDPFILSKNDNVSDDEAFFNRLDDIARAAKNFANVVITCRTQYFPDEENYEYELKIRKKNGVGFYKLNKYYLFPFSNKEVKKYLSKKYGYLQFWKWPRKSRAKLLIKNAHNLMSRPMLLSYLDDFIHDRKHNIKYQYSYQIYEKLIDSWLNRESEKYRQKEQRDQFIENLSKLSHEAAILIYNKWRGKGTLFISKEETEALNEKFNIDLSPDEVKGKSLLTCDPYRNWKFAHKSILEYFLAKGCLQNIDFALEFNFTGMDMTKHFYKEMNVGFDFTNFVKVKAGTFLMGSEDGHSDEKPLHPVKLDDFMISATPVTQAQYKALVGSNPSHFKDKGGENNLPVENVSWNEAMEFCELLQNKLKGKYKVTLPSEAQWEYAAIGGHNAPVKDGVHDRKFGYAGSDKIDEVAWYAGNSLGKTHPVAELAANQLGLYDMSGNVWEWCLDWFDEDFYNHCKMQGTVENPVNTKESSRRVIRGGS